MITRLYNNMEYPVHVEIRELVDSGLEPQHITITPKTGAPVSVSLPKGRYIAHAFANGKELGTKHFTTRRGPVFKQKHYERVKDDPDQRPPWFPPLEVPAPPPVMQRRKFLWIF